MKAVLSIMGFVFGAISIAQTGPAGIGSSATNSFWLDANSLVLTNGSPVSNFDDLSGNGNDFSQLSSTAQPTFITSAVNGLPAIEFDGDDDVLLSGAIPAIESAELTWYVVYDKAPFDIQGVIGGNYTSNAKQWVSYCNAGNNFLINAHFSTGSLTFNKFLDNGSSFNFLSNVISSTQMKTYKNSAIQGTKSAAYTAPTGHNFVSLGQYPTASNSYFLNGHIAEAFVFNLALNDLERNLIDNYLGAKYGIAISNDLYDYESTHNIGLIAIGNDGTNSHTASKGSGAVEVSGATGMTSGEYLLAGHTNVDLNVLFGADLPATISSHSRWSRTWRVDEVGEVGDVDLVFDMSGSNGFGIVGTYNLLIDDDGNFSNATMVSGVYSALTQELSFTVNLNDGDYFTVSGLETPPVAIHSVQSGNWYNSTTWDCGCIPTLADTVFVENTDVVDVDGAGFAYAYTLNIESGATLNMLQPVELTIFGDLSINGTINFIDGALVFNGTTAQNVSGAGAGTVYELIDVIINNLGTNNVTFTDGDFVINNVLHPTDGVLEIGTDANFIINSTGPTTTGRVGIVSSGFSQVGDITVKRFIEPGVAGNRNLASPVVGANLSEWDDSLLISGFGFPDGCAFDTNCYYSVKRYQGGTFANNFIDVTNATEPLTSTDGFEVFLGDNINTFNGATITSSGLLNSSTDIVLSNLPNWWNLLGNPYASPISFALLTKTRIGKYFYIFDASSGSYQWYDETSNTSSIPALSDGKLAIGQGFWTYVTAPVMSELVFNQSSKVSANATFIKNKSAENGIQLTLKQENSTYFNVTGVSFADEAVDVVDELDISYFSTGLEKSSSLYMKYSDTEKLTKNYLKNNGENKTIDFRINCLTDAYYTISPSNISNLTDYDFVYLYDKELSVMIDFSKENNYSFYSEIGDYDRFALILTNERMSDKTYIKSYNNELVSESKTKISQIGHSIEVMTENALVNGTIEVTNLLGQKIVSTYILSPIKGKQYMNISNKYSGIYIVVVREGEQVVATKKIIL